MFIHLVTPKGMRAGFRQGEDHSPERRPVEVPGKAERNAFQGRIACRTGTGNRPDPRFQRFGRILQDGPLPDCWGAHQLCYSDGLFGLGPSISFPLSGRGSEARAERGKGGRCRHHSIVFFRRGLNSRHNIARYYRERKEVALLREQRRARCA